MSAGAGLPRPVLRTARLCLRPFEPADAPAFAEAVRESTATVGHWLPWCHAGYTEAEALAWFAFCADLAARGVGAEYGVFAADTGRLLGGAGLNQIPPGVPVANLGYWLRSPAQGQGLGAEAARALIAHGGQALGLHRIEILAAVGNLASQHTALAAGAQPEALLRRRLPTPRGLEDACVFAWVAGDTATAAEPATAPPGFAPRSRPGSYAVVFTSQRNAADAHGYGAMADWMVELAARQPGYLGVESARRADGLGITVSYWRSPADILAWRQHAEHVIAREQGRARWYAHYELRVVRVERAYGWTGLGLG